MIVWIGIKILKIKEIKMDYLLKKIYLEELLKEQWLSKEDKTEMI